MWISTQAYLADKADAITLRLERDLAVAQVKQQETTLAWFMHRLTQVEQERSKLIFNYTGVKVDAPTYEPEEAAKNAAASLLAANPLNALPSFNDVGDDEALKQGIDWDTEGNIIYGVTK
jgi:hypothetical protein